MIIFFKNYKRTNRVLLSIRSVRHFFPYVDIRCLFLFDERKEEYDDSIIDSFKSYNVKLYFDKKTYNFGINSEGLPYNGLYFTEGLNKIQKIVNDLEDKVLFLDEDNFFTTGETINFLINNEFDLACCNWPSPPRLITYSYKPSYQVNASIICLKPKILQYIFPIPEKIEWVEDLWGHEIHDRVLKDGHKIIYIPTRNYTNYHGDGVFTNDINVIRTELMKAGILNE